MEYSWGTSLHNVHMEEFLRIKTPQWRHGGVLEEQASLMEDMGNEKKTSCYGRCSACWRTSWCNKFWTTLCNMMHHIMNHLWRQCNSNKNKSIKTNQHICRDTKDWSHGSTKPTSIGLSLDAKDFTIYQLGLQVCLI